MSRPVSTSSRAAPGGSAAIAAPRLAGIPRPTSGKPNDAERPAIRRSHSAASANPPPSAGPLTAATSGPVVDSAAKHASFAASSRSLCSRSPPNCVTSIPPQNAGPAP